MGGKNNLRKEAAEKQVTMEIECKYFHDTIYSESLRTIERKVSSIMDIYRKGIKKLRSIRSENEKTVINFKKLVLERDKLFDVSTNNSQRKKSCEHEWGVKMGPHQKIYLKDQQEERKMECDQGVDPVWYRAIMRDQRLRERMDQEYCRRREEQRRGKDFKEIEEMIRKDGYLPRTS